MNKRGIEPAGDGRARQPTRAEVRAADEACAEALAEFYRWNPGAGAAPCRRFVREHLGVSRIGGKRFEAITRRAEQIWGPQPTGTLTADGVRLLEIKPQAEASQPPPVPKRPPCQPMLGRLLSADLYGRTAGLPDGSAAAVTFCLCPHCGGEVKITGTVEAGSQ